MVALNGPLFSQSAQGRLVNLLFKTIGKKSHLTRINQPTDPKSAPQVQRRSFLAALAQAWSISTDAQRTTWNAAPRAAKVSAFHAYIRYNFMRFNEHMWPSMIYPASTPGSTPIIDGTSWVSGPHLIRYRLTSISGGHPRLVGTCLVLAGFTLKGPHQFHYWACHHGPSDRRILWDQATPGNWLVGVVATDEFGQPSNVDSPGWMVIGD